MISDSYQRLISVCCFGLFLLFSCFPLCICQVTDITKRVEFKAERPDTLSDIFEFVNIAVEQRGNGHVYVGARNRLYQLDSRLRNYFPPIITGPVKDDIACRCERDGLTDNINKLLLIDYDNNRIVSCGSVEQGVCELRQMGTLDQVLCNTTISILSSVQHVAAKEDLSTVGFTVTNRNGKSYLLVGSSKTTKDEPVLEDTYDSSFYTISKRYLPRDNLNPGMFSVLLDFGDLTTDVGIRMKEANFADENFRVNFIDGFATNITGYFVLTHPATNGNNFRRGDHSTYISQFCLEQTSYEIHSYLELPLECNVQGIRYTKAIASRTAKVGSMLEDDLGLRSGRNRGKPRDVVFISFVQSNGRPGSAVCMFTLSEIERRFLQLVNRCMKNSRGPKPTPISWIKTTGTNSCGRGQFVPTGTVCMNNDMWEIIQHLQDNILTKNAVFMTNDSAITAIEITPDKDAENTVAFFGTNNGQMIKVRLNANQLGSTKNVHYETVVITPPSEPLLRRPDRYDLSTVKAIRLAYGGNGQSQRVYAMTPKVVVGLPLFNCSQYTDCESCLSAKDPFCGWCTLDSKCTSSGDCEHSVAENSYWFIKSGGSCPRLESDGPLTLTASDSQKQLLLKGFHIPYLRNHYDCSFGDLYSQRVTSIQKLDNVQGSPIQIQCVSPPKNLIPDFPVGEGHLTVPLSLVFRSSDGERRTIVSTNFSFYKCSVYTSCMSCVSTQFNCAWCLTDNICTHQSSTYCPQTNAKQSNRCPQLAALPGGENKVYLTAGVRSNIALPVTMLPDRWSGFSCEIDMMDGNRPQIVRARREQGGRIIRCLNVAGSLPGNVRSSVGSLRVTTSSTGTKIEVDNPHNVQIEVYRCGLGSNGNCGTCLQSPVAWKCGWCEITGTCSLQSGCISWLEASKHRSCKNPEINQFYPSSAPFGGNATIIKLNGVNFERNGNMKISVAGVNCRVLGSNCCEAECVAKSKSIVSDPITLCISNSANSCIPGDDYTTTTKEFFHFVDPKVTSFEPTSGLRGWGTSIVVKGENLDTGNSVVVNVDEKPCIVESTSSSSLKCRLQCTAADRRKREVASSVLNTLSRGRRFTTERRLTVAFDGVQRVAKNGFFDFVDDVAVTTIDPDTTIRNGGLPLKVKGRNLNLIQNARMVVTLPDGDQRKTACTLENRDTLVCNSPSLSDAAFLQNLPGKRAKVWVDIESVNCALRSVRYDGYLFYDVNPRLDNFEGDDKVKIFRGELIYIAGSNLCPDRLACDKSTVRVMVGDMECNVTRLDNYQITCEAGPAEIGSYAVTVLIGGYSQNIGNLVYPEQTEFPAYGIGIIVCVVLVLFLAILGVVCIYRRRAKASDEELKNMHMQMNIMESKVAKVCKEAFAELQTDMCELDMLAAGVGIPYWDYRNYLMRVLFPDPITASRQHTILLSHNMERNDSRNSNRDMLAPRSRIGMDKFNQLLENKIFLLSFIKASERQRTFTMKDRGQVAGLLFIILQNRLPYATEILEDLLADLIRRNLESSGHPKLLLRRSESVAEKMLTHWFSILLYGFMVECAGEPLFTLFRAIKQQVDKGPLDAFTNEARYSLSEDKLLRQTVDHETITLRVTNYMANHEQPEFAVKVLSCDSISQVKRKVLDVAFMNHPYSIRPHPEQIELECRPQRQTEKAPFLLRDEDPSSKVEGEWKQVNTLGYYQVQTNTEVSLIPKKDHSVLNYSITSVTSKASSHLLKRNGSGGRLAQQGDGGSLPRHKQPASSRSGTPTLPQDGIKLWHLVKQVDQDQAESADRGNKMVSEIYLARLLTAKGTIQKYVDDLFETIFSVTQRGNVLPLAVKHMFDFLDHQADIHGITDPEIVHTWKSNCLPLRFWVNLIKNPEFVYDIHKSPIVDCYLSVIAQAFMDSCSTAEYKLGKDSPSNKLLYAREIPEYKEWVKRYYADIARMPKTNHRDLSAFLRNESFIHSQDFNTQAALLQLYGYAQKYSDELLEVLDGNPEARRQQLVKQFHDLSMSLNGSV